MDLKRWHNVGGREGRKQRKGEAVGATRRKQGRLKTVRQQKRVGRWVGWGGEKRRRQGEDKANARGKEEEKQKWCREGGKPRKV